MKKKYPKKFLELTNIKKGYCKCINSKLGAELKELTSFINFAAGIKERLLYVKYDLYEQVKCPTCGGPSKIDLSSDKFRIKFCSYSCRSNYVCDDGMTLAERNGKKLSKTLSKVNPETGLTKAQERALKTAKTLSQINPETGLTKYQEIGKKTSNTLNMINPDTGLTKAQERGIKSHETLSQINPETGLTKYQEIGKKTSNTLNMINPDTGLSIAKERGKIVKAIKSKINTETGLTKYQEIGLKAKETLSKVNPETGLTRYQETQRIVSYKNLIIHFKDNGYTLITSEEEFLINEDFRLIKYQHSCGEIRESYWPYIRCLKCYPYNRSIAETEIVEYCNSFTDNIISNDRQLIKPMELDIVLPNFKLGIEYNGLFWHSSDSIETESPDYHLSKTQKCMENGYQLFHIFENEWEDPIKKDIWKSIISNKLGHSERIYARKCEIRNVDTKEVKSFLKSNHLQGYVPSSINIGLFYNNELVSLMTFGKSRYGNKYDWELLRFCNKKYTSVIGGASKLFKHFTKSNKGIIVSYADMRRSNGNLYDNLGFELSHISEPNYWYFKSGRLILESRIKYQKHKLGNILEEYDSNLTESENMYNNDYRKIYDCGNMVYVYS